MLNFYKVYENIKNIKHFVMAYLLAIYPKKIKMKGYEMKHSYIVSSVLMILFLLVMGTIKLSAAGIGQDLCVQINGQDVHVGTLISDFDASGNIYIKLIVDKNLNDNTYGTTAIGWGSKGHKFNDLVGSDEANFVFKDKNGNVVLEFALDYISKSSNFSSGYGCLGVTGGDGKMISGNSSFVLSYNSSLSRNFNDYGYVLTTNSPSTDANYTPNSTYPNWIYEMIYEVTVSKDAFGTAGFGSVSIPYMHNSPNKLGLPIKVVPSFCSGAIGDFLWKDTNQNGIQDAGEPGIPNVTVQLYDCNTNNLIAATTTDAYGKYSFSPLSQGSYYVQFLIPDGYTVSPQFQGDDQSVDSNPDATGKTSCINLAVGEINTTIDAGIYPTPVLYGSVGDFVWNDVNHDGIQDGSETGIPDVTVQLYDCSTNNLLASMTTNSNGYYLFDHLLAGSYYVVFTLPSGYTFSPALQGYDRAVDSNPDAATGKTACFDLASGENNLTIDAGMYSCTEEDKYPDLCIGKDDGLIIAPDSGNTTTYNITYCNHGTAPLYNAVILDTLPPGMNYVSSSSGQETSPGSNIIKFSLGTLNPDDKGNVSVTAMVTNIYDNYLNKACILGNDSQNNNYQDCAIDNDIKDTTSNCDDGGIESRGDLSELLLQRSLKIKYGMTTPILLKKGTSVASSQFSLSDFIPASGPFDSRAVETTPFDILGISNAISSYAVNYSLTLAKGPTRVGGIFSTITAAPNIYDHSKAVCDRLAGYDIAEIKLLNINGYQFYAAKLSMPENSTTDYAISFSVYESPSGFSVQNKWMYEDYQAPAGAASIYNFQVWSNSYSGTVDLVQKILAKFESKKQLNYMNTSQASPDVFISKAYYALDGFIHLTVINNGKPKNLNFTTYCRVSQGADQLSSQSSYSLSTGTNEVVINSGIISDANVYMNDPIGFNDEVYVGGGAYTYINGPNSTMDTFNTSDFQQQVAANYPEGSIVLSGGVSASGQLKDWLSIVRSLNAGNRPYDLSNCNALKFMANGNSTVEVLVNTSDITNYNYFAYKVNLSSDTKEYTINFDQLKQLYGSEVKFDASKIEFIGFMFTTNDNQALSNINFNVQNIAFMSSNATGINNLNSVPHEFSLEQNYPNPFNPATVIQFAVPKSGNYTLKVYNILGQEVATLVSGELNAGFYRVTFNAGKFASGMYVYSLRGENTQITKKMILMK